MKHVFVFLFILFPLFGHASQPTCAMLFQEKIEQARIAKKQLQLYVKSIAGLDKSIVGGIGLTTLNGEYALKVNVFNKNAAAQIPPAIVGINIVTEVVGVVKSTEAAKPNESKISMRLLAEFTLLPAETVYPIIVRLQDSLTAEQSDGEVQRLKAAGVHVLFRIDSTMMTARANAAAIRAIAEFESVHSVEGSARVTPAR